MHRRTQVALVLALFAVPLLGMPAIAPVDPVLEHNTGAATKSNNTTQQLQYSYAVYDYENLSERAQTLYVEALEAGGTYYAPVGEGAPEFQYPAVEAIRAHQNNTTKMIRMQSVAIVRPENASLPPANEMDGADEIEVMNTFRTDPEIGSGAYVHHILGLLLGLVAAFGAAYLLVAKPEHRFFEK